MRRREFIALVSAAVVGWPIMARAQPPGKLWRIGQVIGGTPKAVGQLAAHLRLASYKLPRGHKIVAMLPRDDGGLLA